MRRERIAFVVLFCSGICHYAAMGADVRISLEDAVFSEAPNHDVSDLWYDLDLVFSVSNASDRTIDIEVGQIGIIARSFKFFSLPSGDQVHMQKELIVTKYCNRVAVSLGSGNSSPFAYSYRCKTNNALAEGAMKYEVNHEYWRIANGRWFVEWRASGTGLVVFRRCGKQNNDFLTKESIR